MDKQRHSLDVAFVLAQVAFPGRVVRQHDAARPEDPHLAVAGRNLDRARQVDDELASRRRMSVQVVGHVVLTKVNARRRHRL